MRIIADSASQLLHRALTAGSCIGIERHISKFAAEVNLLWHCDAVLVGCAWPAVAGYANCVPAFHANGGFAGLYSKRQMLRESIALRRVEACLLFEMDMIQYLTIPSLQVGLRSVTPDPDTGKELQMREKKKKRKDYAFRRQFNEKPSSIPGCPGVTNETIQQHQASPIQHE